MSTKTLYSSYIVFASRREGTLGIPSIIGYLGDPASVKAVKCQRTYKNKKNKSTKLLQINEQKVL